MAPKAQSVSEETICSPGKRGCPPVFLSEGSPICTEQSNNWAANNFEEWRRDYNRRNLGSEIRGGILESMDCQELDEVLSTFTVETRKENGKKYPSCTLYQLLSRLHCYTLLLHPDKDLSQFCSSKNTFRHLHRMLDKLLKELRVEGIG